MKYLLTVVLMCSAIVAGRTSFAADELDPGLVAEIYNIGEDLSDFPDLKGKKPAVTKVDKQINQDSIDDKWPGTDLEHQFSIHWSGVIKIEKDGKYKFYTESDDGSRLLIDGKQVVDNNGAHGMEEKDGDVELKAGDHEFVVDYYEIGGGHGCKASWEGAGIAKEIIPEKVLFHKKGTEKPK